MFEQDLKLFARCHHIYDSCRVLKDREIDRLGEWNMNELSDRTTDFHRVCAVRYPRNCSCSYFCQPRERSHTVCLGGVCFKTGSIAEVCCYAVAKLYEKFHLQLFVRAANAMKLPCSNGSPKTNFTALKDSASKNIWFESKRPFLSGFESKGQSTLVMTFDPMHTW